MVAQGAGSELLEAIGRKVKKSEGVAARGGAHTHDELSAIGTKGRVAVVAGLCGEALGLLFRIEVDLPEVFFTG